MAEDNKVPMARPSADAAQRLVDNGFLTEKTARMLIPPEQANVSVNEEMLPEEELLPSNAEAQNSAPKPVKREIIPITDVPELSGRDVAVQQDFEAAQDSQIIRNVKAETAKDALNEIVADKAKKSIEETVLQNNIDNKKLEKKYQDIEEEQEVAQETQRKTEALKADITSKEAVRSVAAERQSSEQDELRSIEAEIDKERQEMKDLSAAGIMGSEVAGNSIMATIGIILAGAGGGLSRQGGNAALDVLNRKMDAMLNQKDLSIKDKLGKKQRVLDIMDKQLQQKAQNTNDKLTQMKLQQMQSEMSNARSQMYNQQVALRQQEGLNKRLSGSEGLSKEEVFSLDSKMQSRAVYFSDGKARIAAGTEDAKKLRTEVLPNAIIAIGGLNQLKDLSSRFAGGSVSPEAIAEASVLVQSLKGSLRLPLFGPGVMTDSEQALAEKIIGNSTKIFALTALELKKLETLSAKIQDDAVQRLKSSGIDMPDKNEGNIQKLVKGSKNINNRLEAVKALKDRGLWQEVSF
jgi:hypothetical protein